MKFLLAALIPFINLGSAFGTLDVQQVRNWLMQSALVEDFFFFLILLTFLIFLSESVDHK